MNDWHEGPVSVLLGDARARLAELPDASVHCIVTSPYWGLRDFGVPPRCGAGPGAPGTARLAVRTSHAPGCRPA